MKRLLNPEVYVLTAASALSHFWRLFTPNAVVWDEVYYKYFAGHYLDHTFYFDLHPPLANLLFAAVARIAGVPAATLMSDAPVPVLRVLPALCGTLIAPLGYVMLRQLGASRRVATLAGLALLFENALLVDTRLTFVEPQIIAAGLGALTLFLAARASAGRRRWMLIVISGLLAGAAVSLKWTGASALGIILAVWAFDAWRASRWSLESLGEAGALVVIPAAVYVATFAIHFSLLTNVGVSQSFMSSRFRRTLIGDPLYDSTARLSLVTKLADTHDAMRRANRELESVSHPAASRWYTWPIMKHPIGVWANIGVGAGRKQVIILLGNPVVWWGALIGALGVLLWLVRRPPLSPDQRFALGFLGGGFALNFVPFIFVSRLMFLYHYLFALVFAVLLAAYWVGTVAHWNDDDGPLFHFASRRSAVGYWGLVTLIVASFAYFSPLSYGWTISERAFDNRFWVLHPRL
jgi:dolichyl-phosphate-mannose-protein mannosyltransferase